MKINWKKLMICILIPVVLGFLVGLLIDTESYQTLVKPVLSPPKWVFPVVWTILYVLMGISCYLVLESQNSKDSLKWYFLQLFLNLTWSFIFFNLKNYGLAFLWIVLLIVAVIKMIMTFYHTNKVAAYLQIPYFFWLLFAAYLNFGVYLLN